MTGGEGVEEREGSAACSVGGGMRYGQRGIESEKGVGGMVGQRLEGDLAISRFEQTRATSTFLFDFIF